MRQSTTSLSKTLQSSILLVVLTLVSFSSFTTISAVEDQFNVNLSVTAPGVDGASPSVPTGLMATAVSTSQINLSWSASTDNVAVTGYKIYRDSVYITTVGATNYSDTGLSSNTLYAYTVSAIDAAANESALSASASATTFSAATGGGSTGGSILPLIYDVISLPSQTGALITWKTTVATRGSLSWGLTSNYEQGITSETFFDTVHSATISGLLSGTEYLFGIKVESGYGRMNSLGGQTFKTLPITQANLNANHFTATAKKESILLKWNNPTTPNFSEVRIIRSSSFYPADPTDGEVIYEGTEDVFDDSDVDIGTRYYYTLFAKDLEGNYSSGVLASARIPIPGEVTPKGEDSFPNLPPAPNVDPLIASLTFFDFDFIQDGKLIATTRGDESIMIDGAKDLTVSLDYRKVPEVLKTIAITLTHPVEKDRTFSFLLRVNKEKTLYTATIGALGDSGTYKVNISVVDYRNRGLKNIAGELVASAQALLTGDQKFFSVLMIVLSEKIWYILLLIIFILVVLKTIKELMEQKKKRKNIGLLVCEIDEEKKVY